MGAGFWIEVQNIPSCSGLKIVEMTLEKLVSRHLLIPAPPQFWGSLSFSSHRVWFRVIPFYSLCPGRLGVVVQLLEASFPWLTILNTGTDQGIPDAKAKSGKSPHWLRHAFHFLHLTIVPAVLTADILLHVYILEYWKPFTSISSFHIYNNLSGRGVVYYYFTEKETEAQ